MKKPEIQEKIAILKKLSENGAVNINILANAINESLQKTTVLLIYYKIAYINSYGKVVTPKQKQFVDVQSLENEEWKLVADTKNLYVSNMGRTKILLKNRFKLNKNHISCRGYVTCSCSLPDKVKVNTTVHRLVARAFVPIPEEYVKAGYTYKTLDVCHINHNKTNNVATNLRWATHAENLAEMDRDETMRDTRGISNVLQYDLAGNLIATYKSVTEAAKATGIAASMICNCCLGHKCAKTAKGFIFKYENGSPSEKYGIDQFTTSGEFVAHYENIAEAQRALGKSTNSATLTDCLRGRLKTCYGYKWKYSEKEN